MPIVFHENQRVLGQTHSRRGAARRPSPQAPRLLGVASAPKAPPLPEAHAHHSTHLTQTHLHPWAHLSQALPGAAASTGTSF